MNLKIGTKINVMVFSLLIGLAIVIGLLVSNQVSNGIKQFAVEKAKGDVNLGYSFLEAKIPGDWKIENDQLYKGDVLVNDNFDIVDKIGEDTGGTVTIFQGDTRITTNVKIDGERAVGTQVSEAVAKEVLQDKHTYFGEADVAGNLYQAAYRPIFDANDNVVGIFYVGAPQGMITEIVNGIIKSLVIVLVVALIIAGVISAVFANRIKRRMAEVQDVLYKASQGDFTQKLNDTTGDELTAVSESYNMMAASIQDVVKEITRDAADVSQSSVDLLSIAQ